jgi:5-methylcytosine-specific restriction endonuclease McrA
VKVAILKRSGGICEFPGCDEVGREYDHRIPVALDGENTVENIWLSCRSCHRAKTSNEDIPRIAKAKRQARLTGQQARRAAGKTKPIPQPANPWPAKGSRKLQSRGFVS